MNTIVHASRFSVEEAANGKQEWAICLLQLHHRIGFKCSISSVRVFRIVDIVPLLFNIASPCTPSTVVFIYRVSQKFVPLISCTITLILIKTLFLHEISRRCLLLYMYSEFQQTASSLPPPPLPFFVTFCSRCGREWYTAFRATDYLIF